MKTFSNKKTIKNLIIIIFLVIVFSGLLPKPVIAKTDVGAGGLILKPIESFVLFLDDKLMQWMQHMLISTDNIEVEERSI